MNCKIILKIALQNLKIHYQKSYLGLFWIPISFFILIFVKIYLFSDVFDIKINRYLPHIVTGLLFWQFVSNIISKNLNIFYNNQLILNLYINPYDLLKISYAESNLSLLLNYFISILFLYFFDFKVNFFSLTLSFFL